MLGVKWDKRIETPDKGFMQGLDVALYETRLGEYYGELQGHLINERLDDRRNSTRQLNISINRSFHGEASDTLNFNVNRQRRDYYISATGDLESRKEKLQKISNLLNYNLLSWGALRIQSDVSSGSV
ncbi:unnamed protein product, partial [marine sediment metagenome]